ncbi:hypothetical protein ACLMJK_005118 [Lecanora helva]
MPEASASAQKAHLSGNANGFEERSGPDVKTSGTDVKNGTAETTSGTTLKSRKRTKTGCLTCRKRRIKCGEERPTCKNCVKSKRDCEGYIPRVIFKDPLGAFHRSQPGLAVRAPQDPSQNVYGPAQPTPSETPIAPRLPMYTEHPAFGQPVPGDYYSAAGYPYNPEPYPASNQALGQHNIPHSVFSNGGIQHALDSGSLAKPQILPVTQPYLERREAGDNSNSTEAGYNNATNTWPHVSEPSTNQSAELPPMFARNPTMQLPAQIPQAHPWTQPFRVQYPGEGYATSPYITQAQPISAGGGAHAAHDINGRRSDAPNQFYSLSSQNSWVEPEDDYFDVDSDDDDNDYDMKPVFGGPASYNLGPLLAMSANHSSVGIRSMTNFLNDSNVLASYHPMWTASPLMDSQTARIFCHFITATAPTLTVCERRPSNPAVIFTGAAVPKSQRALWSYTLPMLALNHQGLLHAMLALGSLHISKLQHSSPTPSLKHYHYALRRIAKALGNPKKRKDVATLAATLLLGFYEVTTAEHNKWNSHLSGARELVMDIDFAGTAKKIESHRCQQEAIEANSVYQMYNAKSNGYHQLYVRRPSEDFPAREDRQLNENLISTLMGWSLKYNQYGQIIDGDNDPPPLDTPLTAQDIDRFEIQSDLFWWYAKQDVYQSIVSGNRLLLSYDRWSLCPPRAPVGRLDAVYGSLDHLLLLMGRLADFAGKDLPRKLRAHREAQKRASSQSNGGGIPNAQPSPSQGPSTMPNGMQARPMYGMMPDPGPVRVPTGFDQAKHDSIYTAPVPSEDQTLDIATHEAEVEWAAISRAFDVYLDSLGPAYAPLEAEHMTPTATPFGPALYYRSYAISCVLTMYYMGRIVCERVKPNMPPAAMAAAGVAARSTAVYANTIGRIVAGIQPVDSNVSINPHHGAALMDCCMSLFHAGIQYQHPGQRGWTITKLHDIARLTGWQTATLIASGCERAWLKAAEMGRGPPYTAVMDQSAKDDRLAGRGRHPKDLEKPAKDNNDRRFITVNAGTRVYWAMGILGVEEDMKGMKLD